MIFTLATTKTGQPCVELHDGHTLVAKLYPSPDFSKLRLVLPELVNMSQTRIDPDSHYIEFRRSANA